MSIIRKSLTYLSLLLLVLSPLAGKEDHSVESQPIAIEEAITFPNQGILKQKENGFVYLDVPNEFITAVVPLLDHQGLLRARPTASRSMGAHISVFHEDEMIGREIWDLAEAGEWFTFEVKELRYVDRKTAKGEKRLWLLAADSPALERLRTHYGLKPKLLGHDFHITIGNEQMELPSLLEEDYIDIDEVFEFEPAASAA